MNRKEIIEYFNNKAIGYNNNQIVNASAINKILDNACIVSDVKVLDVACGSGLLFDYFLKRKVSCVIGVDISPKMIECARLKYNNPAIKLLVANAESCLFREKFDVIVVYNSFTNFIKQEELLDNLYDSLEEGGLLTIAFGNSREFVNINHDETISSTLMDIDMLAKLFGDRFCIVNKISDADMYQIVGRKI